MQKFKCILLVDDDMVSNFINKEILSRFNLAEEIQTASNGANALHSIMTNYKNKVPFPDLIFLDINMPVMDGFQFLEEIMNLPDVLRQSKLIMLTSSSNPLDIEKTNQYPILGYLNKPLTWENLEPVLARAGL